MGIALSKIEEAIKQLPVFEQTVRDILSLFERGELDLAILQKKIMQDQALTARILRVANSSFYGFPGQIANIKDACIVLGCHTIRNIVISTAVIAQFSTDTSKVLDRTSMWQHAAATGGIARYLGLHAGIDAESAFTAGLLHDIGKLALDTCFANEYQATLQYCKQHDCATREAERVVLGYDHAFIGKCVAERWKLPATLVSAIAFHHEPNSPASQFVDVVHVADILCRGIGIGNCADTLIAAIEPLALQRLGLDWTLIRKRLPEIVDAAKNAMQFIQV